MLPLTIKITTYNKDKNTCTAKVLSGGFGYIEVDPFVGWAIGMTDEDYENDKGFSIVGSSYTLIEYSVYKDNVVPHENGMIELTNKED